jgi:L-fucose isomerase
MIWDQAATTEVPAELAKAMCELTTPIWPHTFVVPKYASMVEYKQYPPANHFHMTWNLPVARLQHWMDLTGVLSVTPWAARPKFIEGVDRPQPLIHLINPG